MRTWKEGKKGERSYDFVGIAFDLRFFQNNKARDPRWLSSNS